MSAKHLSQEVVEAFMCLIVHAMSFEMKLPSLRKSATVLVASVASLAAILWGLVWMGIIPGSYEVCEAVQRANQGHCAVYYLPRFLVKMIGFGLEQAAPAITLFCTVAIALFTATLWWATRGLQRASGEQSIAMRDSIEQAARAASAMERSADAAHEANRPWVEIYTDQVCFGVSREGGGNVYFEISMMNHGNSPATNVFAAAALVALPLLGEGDDSPAIPGIEAKLDEFDRGARHHGKTVFPKIIEHQKVEAASDPQLMLTALGQSKGTTFGYVVWVVAIGVSYSFGDRVFRSVKSYELVLRDGEINYALKDTEHRHSFTDQKLRDRLEGYAI